MLYKFRSHNSQKQIEKLCLFVFSFVEGEARAQVLQWGRKLVQLKQGIQQRGNTRCI